MSISIMTEVWKLDLQAPRKMVLLALADNANDEGTNCYPSVATIVEKCSLSERTVQGHLLALEELQLIKRRERSGRSTNYTLNIEHIQELVLIRKREKAALRALANASHTPINHDVVSNSDGLPTPAISAGVLANPLSINTPAESAGVQHLHPPPHHLHPTPAESAPITTNEPSLTTTTTSRVPFDHCGGGGFSDQLIYPVCTAEERIAIGELLATCPTEFHQKALDEIEGARQAGVIKTNLVPFARGIMTAISRGTFTVGHGTKVAAHRKIKTASTANPRTSELTLDPEALDKGKAFINRLARA